MARNLNADLEYKATIRRIQTLITNGRYEDAQVGLRKILKRRKNDHHAMRLLIEATYRAKRFNRCLELLRRFLKLFPKDERALILLSEILAHRGQLKESLARLKSLHKADPDNPRIIYALADAHDLNGETDLALEMLEPAIESGPMQPDMSWLYSTLLIQKKKDREALIVIDRQLEHEDLEAKTQRKLLYLLGKAHENLDETERSFEAYQRANQIHDKTFDETQFADSVDRLIEVFSPDDLKGFPRSTVDSELPVFIISRPRSGSTLLERIIGAHPEAHAAGELIVLAKMLGQLGFLIHSDLSFPECVRDLDAEDVDRCARDYLKVIGKLEKGALRVTDKTITNWIWVGVISLLFPKAKLIDLRRNPLDTCLSCWTADLGDKFPASFRLDHLALEYKMHIRIMEHWHRVLDVPILRVNYEDLVTDQETWSRKIIDFIGLPWDEKCLRFHETDRTSASKSTAAPTLSYSQVTQPIYSSSLGRAEKFSRYLQPVREILNLGEDERPMGHP